MRAAAFDLAVAERGLTAVRQMSAEGFPILPHAPFTQASQEPDRVDAAEAPPQVSAAFLHFTESGHAQPDMTAPVRPPKPFAGAVTLSEPAMILLKAIAAYEQMDDAAALTLALATHATKIGAGPLARAALDEIERHGDITDVPEFRRSGERRFVLTPKAPDGAFADANDARSGLRPEADTRSGGP